MVYRLAFTSVEKDCGYPLPFLEIQFRICAIGAKVYMIVFNFRVLLSSRSRHSRMECYFIELFRVRFLRLILKLRFNGGEAYVVERGTINELLLAPVLVPDG